MGLLSAKKLLPYLDLSHSKYLEFSIPPIAKTKFLEITDDEPPLYEAIFMAVILSPEYSTSTKFELRNTCTSGLPTNLSKYLVPNLTGGEKLKLALLRLNE